MFFVKGGGVLYKIEREGASGGTVGSLEKIDLLFVKFTMNNQPSKRDNRMSAAKQLAINRLRLPMDVVNIIKDYLFDDLVTGFIKQKKRELVTLFEEAVYSRKNTSVWISDSSEDWLFLFGIGEKQIEGCNCFRCGNYLVAFDHRILCRCAHQNHDIDVDGPIEFDDNVQDFDFDDEPMWDYM
jgi:hypothetical protein